MSSKKLKGQFDFTSFKRELFSFNSVLVETGTISGNTTELFQISEDEAVVDSVTLSPPSAEFPRFGRLLTIRVNIESGSSDTTLSIYEGESGNAIDQVAQITNLDQADSPESFNLANNYGLAFVNQEDENAIHIEIDELSNNNSEYEIKLIWVEVNTEIVSAF